MPAHFRYRRQNSASSDTLLIEPRHQAAEVIPNIINVIIIVIGIIIIGLIPIIIIITIRGYEQSP